ncbi:MAG: protein kinase [Deltaproteobacteria bacterium]|nr:protein kinase [Deltaproteobacteria bacterium]
MPAKTKSRGPKRKGGPNRLVGSTIQGRYHVVRLLGDGGMGAVYKAADQVLRRFVAIKLLHPETAANPSAVERFVREARSSAAIGHPNIIDILDFGYENESPFLVMEYLRGRSLSEAIADEGRMSVERSCNIATHALAGLAAAHDRGILHRDLKPANLMLIALLGDRDFVKLCDFGFAALVQPSVRIDGGKSLTPARTLVGTPAYAAPERLRGDDTRDPRMDVYSIGVVLFEMLAGRRPFDAPTFRELARKVRQDQPPSLLALRNDVPPSLDRVIRKSLAKDRDDRWANAEEFAAALVPFGGRMLPIDDDHPSDSFTMDLLRLRARETQQQRAMSSSEAEAIMEMRRGRREKKRPKSRPKPPTEPPPELVSESIPIEIEDPPSMRTTLNRADNDELRQAGEHAPLVPAQTDPDSMTIAMDRDTALEMARHESLDSADERQVLGTLPLAVIRFVSRRFGERPLTDLLASLAPTARAIFHAGVGEEDWVSYTALDALVSGVDARLGRDDLHLVVQCGRSAAEGCFDMIRALRPPSPPPELLLAEVPRLFAELTRGVEVKVPRVGRGYGRVEMTEEGESSLTFGVFLIGFLDRALDRFGAKDVEVNMISSPALGDAECVYEISWIA